MEFQDLLCQRRSIYSIEAELPISCQRLTELIHTSLCQCPSAFNSQSGRIMLLIGTEHWKLWQMILDMVAPLTPASQLPKTQDKISSFAAGFGTILFFNDSQVTRELQDRFPVYKDNFSVWAEHSQGMLQFIVWSILAENGIGASLQHYNPLIDTQLKQEFAIPDSWQLSAQMPFGKIVDKADPKTFIPVSERFKFSGCEQ